jgi:hypothetical protein
VPMNLFRKLPLRRRPLQAELDLAGTLKCNCTGCTKARSWLIPTPATHFASPTARLSGGISMDAARTREADRRISLLQTIGFGRRDEASSAMGGAFYAVNLVARRP